MQIKRCFLVILGIMSCVLQAEKGKHTSGYAPVSIDPQRIQLLGVTTEKIMHRKLFKTIRTVGIVAVDETRIAHIQTKFGGWIEELFIDFIGKPVKQGQPFFSVYSPELVATQEEYLLALNEVEQPMEGVFGDAFNKASLELLQSARNRLELWDISEDQIKELEQSRLARRTLLYRSPIDGIVLDKTAFIGMNVSPGLNLFTIANLSHVWVLADLYEHDLQFVKIGDNAKVSVNSLPGVEFNGKVTFIDYVLDMSTRTVKARLEFVNPDLLLKPGMFGALSMDIYAGNVLSLPEEALIDTGKRKIVFVDKGKGRFEPKEVQLGFKAGAFYEILAGISEGQAVVTSSQFLIDSESRLKAQEKQKMHAH